MSIILCELFVKTLFLDILYLYNTYSYNKIVHNTIKFMLTFTYKSDINIIVNNFL